MLYQLRRKIAQSVRRILADTDKPRFVPDPTQPALFDFDSTVRLVHLDAAMLIGGIRALLLQSLHPKAMAAMVDHSDYQHDPFGRLRRTVDFLGYTTYGTLAKAEECIAAVQAIHNNVHGTTSWGEPYNANDPHLLRWVHIAEVDSFLAAHELFGRPALTAADKDRYVADMTVIVERLGADHPPASWRQLQAAIHSYRPELKLLPEGRRAVGFLEDFPFSPLAKAAYRILYRAAVGSLPSWAQLELGYDPKPAAFKWFYRPVAHAMIRFLDWGLKVDLDLDKYPRPGSADKKTAAAQ